MTTPTILIVEDDALLSDLMSQSLEKQGYYTISANSLAAARNFLSNHEPALILMDNCLPDGSGMELFKEVNNAVPVVLLTAYGSIRDAVDAIKAGVAEYLVKPIDIEALEVTIKRVLENTALRNDYQFYKSQIQNKHQHKRMVGKSSALTKIFDHIDKVAPTNMSILIQGESGVGKELVAAEIHNRSDRSHRNFVALDCCSLQEKLFESELFGHERGAFTGADRQKKGLIEGADGGTLFLDEIGEIEPSIQAKLLRVLETGTFRRVGSNKDLTADVRIVAATNCNLEHMSREGKFRLDLFYRLSGFVLTVPSLRERTDDIPLLVKYFINNHRFSRRVQKKLSPEAMMLMRKYGWPGNVRELKNVVERAIILSGDEENILPEHLTFTTNSYAATDRFVSDSINSSVENERVEMPPKNSEVTLPTHVDMIESSAAFKLAFDHEPTLEEIEALYLSLLLDKYDGHRFTVAKVMGISERNTYRLLKKYGLNVKKNSIKKTTSHSSTSLNVGGTLRGAFN